MVDLPWGTEADWTASTTTDIEITGGTFGLRPVIPDGAIHRYQFESGSGTTVVDSIGTADGTITGATWIQPTGRHGEYALRFDGTDDSVDISGWGTGITEFSLSLLQYVDEWSSGERQLAFIGDGAPQFELWKQGGGFRWSYWDGSTDHGITAAPLPPTGQVNHIVGVFASDGTFRLYYNGSEVASATSSASLGFDGTANRIGGHPSVGRHYGGWVDDVIPYDRTLSASEVTDLHDVYQTTS